MSLFYVAIWLQAEHWIMSYQIKNVFYTAYRDVRNSSDISFSKSQ